MSREAELKTDPLLECLVIFAKTYHRPVSIDALVAGLPAEPGAPGPVLFSITKPKGLFSRIAERAGLASRLMKCELEDLSELLLPCILVLKDQKACILDSIDETQDRAKIILPQLGEGEQWIDFEQLREQFLGFAFLLKQPYVAKDRHLGTARPHDGHWLWGTLRRSKEIYLSVVLASVMVNCFVLATPLFTMNVYDRVVPNDATDTLWVLAVGAVIVFLFDAFLRLTRTYLLEVAGKKCDVIMSSMLFERILDLRMAKWPKSVGAFANRLSQFENVRSFFTASTLVTLVDLPFAVIFLLVIAYIGDALVAVPLITISFLLLYSLILVRPLKRSIEETYEAAAHKHSLLVETLDTIQTIKALGTARHAQWEWEESTGDIATKMLHNRTLSGTIAVVTNFLVQLNMVGVVALGVYQIIDLELSLGGLIAVSILSSRAVAPMAQVAALITNYQQAKTSYHSLNALMQLDVERPEGKTFVRRPDFKGRIELQDIRFTYPDSEKQILSGLSFKVAPGEHVGIIGRVGCGKTTVSKLLLGLYRPDEGSLSIDGIDIDQIDPADLRHGIAYMSQDIEVKRGTIRNNIAMKDPHADDEAILAAAKVAGVDLFVDKMPKGYDTAVGEHGHGLSGGQRQCLVLARTVLLGEPIIVLDEPTNSMDNTTEAAIIERLKDYAKDKTLILITHKAPLLELVDRLIVVEDGRVAMDGPKQEVMDKLQGPRTEF